ncbi:hypothetical protein DITRI_Ditri07aG0163500 [Diplodiscus trichospermus]
MDRLSDLPDSIILHILSFVETKFSVRTCVLSRRWKCLWASVADLDLNASCSNIFWFKKFVRQVLARRNDIPLDKFTFHYPGMEKSLTDSVVDYAVSHGVKHLSFRSRSNRSTPMGFLNPVLCRSQSMTTLELSHFRRADLLEYLSP